VHERDFLVEVDAQLVPRKGNWRAFYVDVDWNFFCLVVFDTDAQVVLETSAGIVEHGQHNLLALFFMEEASCGFAEQADAFVVAEVHLLGSVECSVADEGLAHF
jgi:hypothetical protein